MKVVLIRHGQTKGNLEHRYVGSTDEGLLPQESEQLRKLCGVYPEPDCLFVSPKKRCIETAALLYPDQSPECIADLRECEFGAFEYKNYKELQGNAEYQAWIDSGGTLAFPGGESREVFEKRCVSAFEQCCMRALRNGSSTVGFVVHGGTIMAVLDRFSVPHRDYFDWQVKNAEGFVCELQISNEKLKLTEILALRQIAEACR